MNDILHQASKLENDQIFELTTPFVPAPILDLLKSKDYNSFCIRHENHVLCYIKK